MKFNTRLLHGREVNRYAFGGTQPAVAQSSAFACKDGEELEKIFNSKAPGFAYTRVSNPTVDAFERRVCELEGGMVAVACASGMAAVTTAILNTVSAGDELIAPRVLFGGTLEFFEELKNFGITVREVPELTAENIKAVFTDKTRAVFGEIVSNTYLDVVDVKAVADLAHAHGVPLIVDATTVTPYILRPIELGADIVVHSTSKYINGSGNSISGIIIDSGRFKWDFDRFRGLAPYRKLQRFAYVARLRGSLFRNLGGCLAPFNAFLNVMGMETLGLRMERICKNARALAEALDKLEGISVNYPGLESSPYYAIVRKQQQGNGGGILTIRAGSRERALKLMNALKYASLASNIGDLRTLVINVRPTIFRSLTDEDAAAVGVYDDTLRVSVGIEDPEDLIEDFTAAVKAL